MKKQNKQVKKTKSIVKQDKKTVKLVKKAEPVKVAKVKHNKGIKEEVIVSMNKTQKQKPLPKKLKEKLQKETRNLSSKISRVLSFMMLHNGITTIQAINELGDTRLSASVFELKAKGYNIGDVWMEVTNRYGEPRRIKRYFLLQDKLNTKKAKK